MDSRIKQTAEDIAECNMRIAIGLPGAEELDSAACLQTLDEWARYVREYTDRSQHLFRDRPADYSNHVGLFSFIAMVTALKHPRGLGVDYVPTAIGNFDFRDSRDDFLHGVLTRRLGTCMSLPVLFVAIGRRLGYPMHLAVANGHVFCQWVDDQGRINLEGSCRGGGDARPDEHFLKWPYPLTPAMLASGRYLRPLTPNEELALFLETRGHCLNDNNRFTEARVAYEQALQVAPTWSMAEHHLYQMAMREAAVQSHSKHAVGRNT